MLKRVAKSKKEKLGLKAWFAKPKNKYLCLVIISLAIVLIDGFFIVQHIREEHQRQAFIKSQISQLGSQNVPSSKKPSPKEVASYTVAPTLPKYLIIPAIGVKARVAKLYTTSQNQIQAPDNIYDTGWYVNSSLPGQPGAMFIDGHVSSWTANGVFYDLKNLKPGDTIQVQRGDNKIFTYIVNKLQTYPNTDVDMTQALAPTKPGTAALNLMTCTGSVIKGTSEFNQRLVVYSTLQN